MYVYDIFDKTYTIHLMNKIFQHLKIILIHEDLHRKKEKIKPNCKITYR